MTERPQVNLYRLKSTVPRPLRSTAHTRNHNERNWNNEYFELAAQLGKALKEDKRLVALEEARVAYESDERVMKLMMEYEVQNRAMQNEATKAERDDALIGMIQSRIDALYDQIVGTDTYKALEAAQNEVNDLMTMVNNTITFNITGEQPSSCTHNCSTCGGCH